MKTIPNRLELVFRRGQEDEKNKNPTSGCHQTFELMMLRDVYSVGQ